MMSLVFALIDKKTREEVPIEDYKVRLSTDGRLMILRRSKKGTYTIIEPTEEYLFVEKFYFGASPPRNLTAQFLMHAGVEEQP